jgi:thymidylate synthase
MTNTDKVYLELLNDILDHGVEKTTRAGDVYSVFGRQIRFDLKEGLPLLTTKKVFTKGIIHELLWFLQRPYNSHGSMNIEYLVRNGVHIWDDDAYRWFKNDITKKFKPKQYMICTSDDYGLFGDRNPKYEYWIENEIRLKDSNWLQNITKEEFIDLTLQKVEMWSSDSAKYRFGDLGPVYGKQWRSYGIRGVDQIWHILQSLRNNPNDRRMLCLAYNPSDIEDMALPPCHVMFQFYTRELTKAERMKIFNERYMKGEIPQKYHDWFKEYSKNTEEGMDVVMPSDGSNYDIADIPKYGLSCMWVQRSVDTCAGLPFNITSYSILTYMIASLVNMVPDELIGSLGDCHIYKNHVNGVMEQLQRNGSDIVPKLKIKRKVESIDDFRFDDFEITDYYPDPPIKFQLNVG